GGFDTKERDAARARFDGVHSWKCRHHHTSSFCLPPRVDDRTLSFADLLVKPSPSFWVDGLTDRPEKSQRAEVLVVEMRVPGLDERADRRRSCVEDRDPVLLDD